jgi:DNA-binding transcriptional LysR family regulator
MINEVSIQCFLNLCETLSFTETSRRMFMTQQSVSKYIAKLEEDLGLTLFLRTRHYVHMTEAGATLYKLFSEFDQRYRDTLSELQVRNIKRRNSLSVGHLEWLDLSGTISRAMRLMKKNYPELRLRGEKQPQYELNQSFLKRELDLIITYQEFEPKGQNVESRLVLETPLVMLVHPENPLVSENATSATFRYEPFIKAAASGESISESRARALVQCRELGLEPREVIIAPNLESGYLAAELGQGVMVSTALSRVAFSDILLCYPLGKNESLKCFWYSDSENRKEIEVFSKCLQEAASLRG